MKTSIGLLAVCGLLLGGCGGGGGEPAVQGSTEPAFAPDVAFVVEENGQQNLYVADAAGSKIVKLSGGLPVGNSAGNAQWSPDRTRIAFLSDSDGDGARELHVVPSTGGAIAKLSGTLGDTTYFQWSPDGTRLTLYAAGHNYVVLAAGGAPTDISGTITPGAFLSPCSWSPSGSRLLFLVDEPGWNNEHLYSVLPDGSGKAHLCSDVSWMSILGFTWSPDGTKVAYRADQDLDGYTLLYVAKADGSGNVRVSGPLGAVKQTSAFQWSPDGTRVLFLGSTTGNSPWDLYSATADGSQTIKLADGTIAQFGWSPDGSKFAFLGDPEGDSSFEVYAVSPAGGPVTKLSGPLVAGGDVEQFGWSPDSTRLVLWAAADVVDTYELYVADADGTNRVKVSGILAASEDVMLNNLADLNGAWSPDGTRLVGPVGDMDGSEFGKLYLTGANGSGWVGPVAPGKEITDFRWTLEGGRLLYAADELAPELYSALPNGTGVVKLSPAGARLLYYSVK